MKLHHLVFLLCMTVCPYQVVATYAQDPFATAVKELPGFVSWKELARGKSETAFPHTAKKLENKTVKLMGFMLPLDQADGQKHFLLSPRPSSCSFCLPAGPDQLVEVFSKKPVQYTFDPVKVEGTLTFLRNDPMGMMYRIADGHQIEK